MKGLFQCRRGQVSWGLYIFLGVFAVLFIGGALMLTNMGPGRGGSGGKAPKNLELEAKRGELKELIESTPMWTVEELDGEKVTQLEKVVQHWEAISRLSVGRELKGYDRIENLLSMWGKRESIQLEEQARELIARGGEELDNGIELLEVAATRQRKVNARFPNATGKDMKRVMSLEAEAKSLLAEPILARVTALEKKGKLELGNGEADLALASFEEAEKKLRELHVKFPNYSNAHVGRLAALSKLKEKAASWEEIHRLRRMLASAETAVQSGRFLSGAKMFQSAQKGLRKLTGSSGSEMEKMLEMADQGIKQAVIKHYEQQFTQAWQQVDQLLRQSAFTENQLWNQVAKVREIQAEMEKDFSKYSDQLPGQLQRLEFLEKKKGKLITQIQNLRSEFIAVPQKPDWRMMRSEVSQELYTGLLEGPNPSRNKGDQLPVESVTIVEAQNFAEKASWLLGEKIVLPSEELFFAVAGRPQSANQIPIIPLGRMVPVKSGKTVSGGFYHLWGNVSEWLAQKDPNIDLAEHTGGHFLDTGDSLFQSLIRKETIRDRSRSIGFRIAYQVTGN